MFKKSLLWISAVFVIAFFPGIVGLKVDDQVKEGDEIFKIS